MNNQKFTILEMGETLSVVEFEGAERFMPLIMKGNDLYEPEYGFRPYNAKPKQKTLAPCFIPEAEELLLRASESWTPPTPNVIVEEKVVEKEVIKEVVKEVKPQTPYHVLDDLIVSAVSKMVVGEVTEQIKPMLEEHIKSTFGILPQIHEIRRPERDVKTLKGRTHHKFDTILRLVEADVPVFLTGAAGSGKNVLCKQVAEALDAEFYFSNAVTQEYKLTGFIDANGRYHETQFYKAFTQGGIFMLDEIDASTPEVLVILNAAIANRYFDFPTGRVDAHEDFRIVAAGNTYGTGADIEYTGRYQLDASSLDRFAIVEIDYDSAIEDAIAQGNMELVQFVRDFRKTVHDAKIKFVVSYRSIERLVKLEQVFDMGEAIRLALIRGLGKEDAKMVAKNIPDNANRYTRSFIKMVNA